VSGGGAVGQGAEAAGRGAARREGRAQSCRAQIVAACALIAALGACGKKDDPRAGAAPTVGTSDTNAAPVGALAPSGEVRTLPAPAGDVAAIVREITAREAANGRRLVVYVGASWCEPCQRFHGAAARGELDKAFPDLSLLEFDADADGDRLARAGYTTSMIPYFGIAGPDGRATDAHIEGSIKGDGAVAEITPRLKTLLGP
jgi:hypothetical protein